MKKTSTIFIVFFLFVNCILRAQSVSENIIFDNYVSPTNNDLENHFYSSGFGMSLTAIPSNGITGGCLLTNDTNIWGNDNAIYCSKFKATIGTTCDVNICFKYDTTVINSLYYERPVSIWLNPSADWNHYLIATVSRAKKFEQITYGWVNPTSPTLFLEQDKWYRLRNCLNFISPKCYSHRFRRLTQKLNQINL